MEKIKVIADILIIIVEIVISIFIIYAIKDHIHTNMLKCLIVSHFSIYISGCLTMQLFYKKLVLNEK
jgi:hypothetical protein